MKKVFNRFDISFPLIGLGEDNVNDIYERNLKDFYVQYSETLSFNGEQYNSSKLIERISLSFLKEGRENIIPCKTKDGRPLTEIHFVEYQLKIFAIDLEGKDFKQNELIKIYRDFLNKKKKELLKPDYNKKKGDLLTQNQKQIINSLINMGHKDSHVYNYLKNEVGFITISESTFVNHLNKNHSKNYKANHRFTQPKNLQIPKELIDYFEELKSNQ